MADTDLRLSERRWREERSFEAGRDYVAARLRAGRVTPAQAQAPGDVVRQAAQERTLEGLVRRDPELVRRGLSGLDVDGPVGGDLDAPLIGDEGIVFSPRDTPCTMRWRSAEASIGALLVAGWLDTLSRSQLLFLWVVSVLSEPAVAEEERRAVLAEVLGSNGPSWDALAEELSGVVEAVTWNVQYVSGGWMEGGPPAIRRTFPRLVHGLLRRGLVCHAHEAGRSDAALAVVCAVMERAGKVDPPRPELTVVPYRSWGDDPRSVDVARRELRDDFGLRGALSVVAVMPGLHLDTRLRAAMARLVPHQVAREMVASAVAAHLGPILDQVPEVAQELLRAAREGQRWSERASPFLVSGVLQFAEGWGEPLRRVAEQTLRALAVRGEAADTFVFILEDSFASRPWRQLQVQRGPWLRGVTPDLIRALASSANQYARVSVATMWGGGGPSALPGLADVHARLAADPDAGVRETLRTGEIDW